MELLTIVLELDECLVFSCEAPMSQSGDFIADNFQVYRRPFLSDFLEFVCNNFDVGIWTTRNEDFANAVISNIWPHPHKPKFVLTELDCDIHFPIKFMGAVFNKDLECLSPYITSLRRVLAIDNEPSRYALYLNNVMPLEGYFGGRDDRSLLTLIEKIQQISAYHDIPRLLGGRYKALIAS